MEFEHVFRNANLKIWELKRADSLDVGLQHSERRSVPVMKLFYCDKSSDNEDAADALSIATPVLIRLCTRRR
jgi:Holliday junction resolvasome RuvABC endonuclease subunit